MSQDCYTSNLQHEKKIHPQTEKDFDRAKEQLQMGRRWKLREKIAAKKVNPSPYIEWAQRGGSRLLDSVTLLFTLYAKSERGENFAASEEKIYGPTRAGGTFFKRLLPTRQRSLHYFQPACERLNFFAFRLAEGRTRVMNESLLGNNVFLGLNGQPRLPRSELQSVSSLLSLYCSRPTWKDAFFLFQSCDHNLFRSN